MEQRPLNQPDDMNYRVGSIVVTLLFALAIPLLFLDYGVTNDESIQRHYGNAVLVWYSSFFSDDKFLAVGNLKYYGAFFEVLAQLAANAGLWLGYPGIFEIRHLINAVFGFIGLVFAGRIGHLLGGWRVAFFSLVFLSLTPRYFGHSFNNPKDIPFAALQIVSLFYLFRVFLAAPSSAWSDWIKFGISLGLSLGIRIASFLLVGYAGLLLIAGIFFVRASASGSGRSSSGAWKPLVLKLCAALVLAYLIMLLFWPAAARDPLLFPLKTLGVISQFPFDRLTFFNGVDYPGGTLPRYYLPLWLLLTLPEFYFLAFIAFLLTKPWKITLERVPRTALLLLLVLFVLLPLSLVLLTNPVLYDGVRHFLFLLPALAILAALAVARFMEIASGKLRASVLVLLTASIGLTLYDTVTLHPYQTVYFNRIWAGGLPYASTKFETDYWGNAYREGADWIRKNYPEASAAQPLLVGSCDARKQVEYYLKGNSFGRDEALRLEAMFADRDNWRSSTFLTPEERADRYKVIPLGFPIAPRVFLSTTRFHCHKKIPGRVVYTVRRKGVPILYVQEDVRWPGGGPPNARNYILRTPFLR